MGLYKYLKETYKKPKQELKDIWQKRLIKWRREPTIVKLEKPTRIDRARTLGYKAKQGYITTRIRLISGGRKRPLIKKGRRTKHRRRKKIVGKSYRWIAEERVQRKYPNCEVIGSYWVIKDGKHRWYEVILADRVQVSRYKGMDWLRNYSNKGRVYRGRTSAGKKSRGLMKKGKGAEKARPSLRAHERRGKN